MKTRVTQIAATAAAVAALAFVGPVDAHHSIGMFDVSTPIWVKGRIVSYKPGAPHAMIELEERSDDGAIRRWTIEGPWPGRLERIMKQLGPSAGDGFLAAGATIEVCGFALKPEFAAKRLYSRTDSPKDRFVHGQLIVMPDGRLQSWGPYGKLENCVRPGEKTELWVDFLNADPLARGLWCNGLRYGRQFATVPAEAFVEEVSGRIEDRCE